MHEHPFRLLPGQRKSWRELNPSNGSCSPPKAREPSSVRLVAKRDLIEEPVEFCGPCDSGRGFE